jgi:hypothetical protein
MDVKAYLQAPVPRWLALTAIVSTGAATAGVTYFQTRKKFYADLDAMVEEQVESTRRFFDSLEKEKTPTQLLVEKNYEEMVEEYKSPEDTPTEAPSMTELHEVTRNVFTDAAQSDFDFEKEIPLRTPDKPYVIEHDEFYESDRQTITLTWFEGDEVLADEKDEHIPNPDHVIGDENLQRFGYGSRDPHIVYVRNEAMDVDFEVVKNEGKYTEQVLGFMQHEDKVGVRKFRTYDD